MNDDLKLVITSTFGIVVLAWVLTHASQVDTVTKAGASAYATAVGALRP